MEYKSSSVMARINESASDQTHLCQLTVFGRCFGCTEQCPALDRADTSDGILHGTVVGGCEKVASNPDIMENSSRN